MKASENLKSNAAVSGALKSKKRKLNRVGGRIPTVLDGAPSSLSQRMTQRRLELSLTQAQVARQVHYRSKSGPGQDSDQPLSRNAYCMYEIGKTEPDLKKLEAISKALNVSPGWLAFGTGTSSEPFADHQNHNKSGTAGIGPEINRTSDSQSESPVVRRIVIELAN